MYLAQPKNNDEQVSLINEICHWLNTDVRYGLQSSTGSDAETPLNLEHKVVVWSRHDDEDKHPTRGNTGDWVQVGEWS